MAYVLLAALRRIALAHTRLARATCGSIRFKLLKIGAQVRVSTRRIRIAMASGSPCQPYERLDRALINLALQHGAEGCVQPELQTSTFI